MDSKGDLLKLKLYPPLRNAMEGVYFVKGGSIWNIRWKQMHCQNQGAFALQLIVFRPVQKYEHKRKKEKTPPLEIRDKVQKDFIVVCKKCLTKHGGQVVKQVSKLEKIFERIISLEIITKTNHNMVVLDHTFSIWICSIVMFL